MELEIVKAQHDDEDDGKWIVEGFASTSDVDEEGDVVAEEALAAAVDDLKKYPVVFYNHNTDRPIGRVLEARYVPGSGLFVKVQISKTEPEIWQKIQEGVLCRFSIRAVIESAEERWSEELKRMVRVVKKMSIREISIVSLPANPNAKVLNWYIEKALREVTEMRPEVFKPVYELVAKLNSDEMAAELRERFDHIVKSLDEIVAEWDESQNVQALKDIAQEVDKIRQLESNEVTQGHLIDLVKALNALTEDTGSEEPSTSGEDNEEMKSEEEEAEKAQDVEEVVKKCLFLVDKLLAGAENEKEKAMLQEIKALLGRLVGKKYPYPSPYPYPYPGPEGKALDEKLDAVAKALDELKESVTEVAKAVTEVLELTKALSSASESGSDESGAEEPEQPETTSQPSETEEAVKAMKDVAEEVRQLTKMIAERLPLRKGLQSDSDKKKEEDEMKALLEGSGKFADVHPIDRLKMILEKATS